MEFKSRKWLGHAIPSWVDLKGEVYFITVCCKTRGSDILIQSRTANSILESVEFRKHRHTWYPFIFLIMPDHVHSIFRFGPNSGGMEVEIRNWKSWIAKSLKIKWQNGFFDHRIRDENSFSEKYEYILQNPVRAGLVTHSTDWKWKIESED